MNSQPLSPTATRMLSNQLGRLRRCSDLTPERCEQAVWVQKAIKRELKRSPEARCSARWLDAALDLVACSSVELMAYLKSLPVDDVRIEVLELIALADRRMSPGPQRRALREFTGQVLEHLISAAETDAPISTWSVRSARTSDVVLTASQRSVREFVLKLGRTFFSGVDGGLALRPRLFPLIAGPTGVGKSHLVRSAARQLGVKYLGMSYGNWVPLGAASGQPSRLAILETLAAHPRVLLHIDELDKWPALVDGQNSSWHTCLSNDLWAVLDQEFASDDMLAQASAEIQPEELAARVHSGLWIVGSGTWQDVFEESDGSHRRLGFAAVTSSETPESLSDRVRSARKIAPELIARFNTELQLLTYPKASETARLLRTSGISRLASSLGVSIKPEDIDYRLGGMRVLESLATSLLVRTIPS